MLNTDVIEFEVASAESGVEVSEAVHAVARARFWVEYLAARRTVVAS